MSSLNIEILNGQRKGESLSLTSGKDSNDKGVMPFLLETEAVIFRYQSKQPLTSVRLLLQDSTIDFNVCNDEHAIYDYEAHPRKRINRDYDTLFYNYFGVAILSLELNDGDSCQTITFEPFEVMASKLSGDQAECMIDFILDETQGDLTHMPGATKLGASLSAGGEKPELLIEQLQKDILVLDKVFPYIIHQPLSILASKLDIRDSCLVSNVQEQGIGWLIENLSVLQETDDHSQAHFIDNGIHYRAKELQVAVTYEHTDIYENRVVHGYISHLLKLTHKLILKYEENSIKGTPNTHVGYISFFSSMKKALDHLNSQNIIFLRECQQKLLHLQAVFNKYIPVSQTNNSRPKITAKVKGNGHYLNIFRTMVKWYEHREINWLSHELWLAIDSVPKLFEYYCVLQIVKWCKEHLSDFRPIQENTWQGKTDSHTILLHYEPIYWMVRHTRAGDIVNTELRNTESSKSDHPNKKRNHRYQHRSPDIVLEIRPDQNDKPINLFILDAKYTTKDRAFDEHLPECTMKYVHGITSMAHDMTIQSMLILYPDKEQMFLDYHASPFNLFGERSQLPILGIQPLSIPPKGSKELQLEKTLSRLFELKGISLHRKYSFLLKN